MKRVLVLLWVLVGLLGVDAWAVSVEFQENTFMPEKGVTSRRLILKNVSNDPEAQEILMFKRSHEIDGTEVRTDASSEFLVYPSQVVLMPGERKVITVLWTGEKKLTETQAYRLQVKQANLNELDESDDAPKIQIVVLTNYTKSVYVSPPGAKANLFVESSQRNDEENTLEVILKNDGNDYREVYAQGITIKQDGEKDIKLHVVEEEDKAFVVLPNEQRRLSFSWPRRLKHDATYTVLLNEGAKQ